MPRVHALLLALATSACTGGESSEEPDENEWGYELDPHVDSYVPDSYVAPAPQRIVFLGDSITAGLGVADSYDELMVENDDEDWPDHDELDLEHTYPELGEVVDESIGGATTSSLISQQLPNLEDTLGYPAPGETLVVMTIGGNDIVELLFGQADIGAGIDEVLENLAEIIGHFQDPDHFPDGTYIYLSNVYEPTDQVGQAEECFWGYDLSSFQDDFIDANDGIRALAEELGVGMVDMYGHFQGHGYNAEDDSIDVYHQDDPTTWFQSDCIHPNARGH
ncbi:MAG: SGNH/GDSL hydrolase family protein, partial [Myxococcota bacterium]|nr:SGNH/GDSL hydrolase family protein [Myxococcota bacterium]